MRCRSWCRLFGRSVVLHIFQANGVVHLVASALVQEIDIHEPKRNLRSAGFTEVTTECRKRK
jgi:hypothetical protein